MLSPVATLPVVVLVDEPLPLLPPALVADFGAFVAADVGAFVAVVGATVAVVGSSGVAGAVGTPAQPRRDKASEYVLALVRGR